MRVDSGTPTARYTSNATDLCSEEEVAKARQPVRAGELLVEELLHAFGTLQQVLEPCSRVSHGRELLMLPSAKYRLP